MKTCICTVIKNEHQYLDEWIQYHLHLGIDYIFIFEDIDSESHKGITDKYNQVSLLCTTDILNEKDKLEAKELKKTKRYNIQHLYYRNILNYIKMYYVEIYDWCFVIDADEFITTEDNKELQLLLTMYTDYDAVIMKWKCFGANGLVSKPDYSQKGVVDTYVQEIIGIVPDSNTSFMKTCYNLKNYKPDFFFNQHHPSKKCNWVNTNYEKTWEITSFHNIFVRHYITKSFEEYIWKYTKRGFCWGGRRNFEFFFAINPELNCIKKELMQVLEDEILVVLPYKQSGSQGSELELALSLWRKNCTFNYHFVVIGEYDKTFEEKFPWVEFIYNKSIDKVDEQYTQHLDVIRCMNIIYGKYKNKYNGFIWMVDDNYAIKPFTLFDILQTHYHSQSFTGNSKAPKSYWNHNKWKTRQLLDRENLPHINYTTHFPCWFDFEKLLAIIEKYDLMNESYVLEDIYFNYYEHEKPIKDDEIRLGIWNYDIYKREFQKALEKPNIKFMCNSVEGWSKDLENDLRKLI